MEKTNKRKKKNQMEINAKDYPALCELAKLKSEDIKSYEVPLKKLLNSDEIYRLVFERFEETINDLSEHEGIYEFEGEHITLYEDDVKSISYTFAAQKKSKELVEEPEAPLGNFVNEALIGVYSNHELPYTLYNFETKQLDVFVPNVELVKRKQGVIKQGDTLIVKPGAYVYEFTNPEEPSGLVRVGMKKSIESLIWLFDYETKKSTQSGSASVLASKMEYVIKLMECFPDAKNIKPLMGLAEKNDHHFIRWDAIKSLIHHDLDSGIEMLFKAKEDTHIHVRNAATSTINNFKQNGII